jgi:iron complex outermembrane recepter protein
MSLENIRSGLLSLCTAALLSSLVTLPALAQSRSYHFDIANQTLSQALRTYGQVSGQEIIFTEDVVASAGTTSLKGDYTAQAALDQLLKGTGLTATRSSSGALMIRRAGEHTASSVTSTAAGASHLAQSNAYPGPQSTADDNVPSSSPASSDSDKSALDEIVVTGTNITGVDNKTIPMLVFDRAAIDRSGYATTADFILSLPQNVKSGSNSADGVLTGNGITNIENSTAANLRGLGASSTLTLLNGHRVAPSSYGSGVDLSMIPLSSVERIEVLTDGSSAVYGADAVGGVINIILRKDFNGQETSARFDTLTQGGGEQKQIGQSVGRTWNSGGALAVFQFQDSNAIHADQRAFTQNLPEPTDVYPSTKRYSGIFSGHQSFTDALELFSDVLVDHDDGFRAWNSGGEFGQVELLTSKTNSQSANVGLRWQAFGDWHLEGDTLFSQSDSLAFEVFTPDEFGYTNGTPYLRNLFTIKEADLKLDGTIWSSGASSLKGAVGGSYRREDFSSLIPYSETDRALSRRISALFAEAYAPLISEQNSVTLIKKLEFSAAVRRDSYSDLGGKTNPRLGIFWSPIDQIGLRAAYSTSFRVPNPSETLSLLTATNAYVLPGYLLPNGTTGNALFFANRTLGPESSHNISAGLDFHPTAIPSTQFSLNYYRIVYANRIISSPDEGDPFASPSVYGPLIQQFGSDAAAAAFLSGLQPPQTLIDLTPGGTGLTGVRVAFPYGEINAAKLITEGLDLGAHSLLTLSGRNKLVLDLNATYIRELETTFCSACTSTDLVNTYGQPLRLRARGAAGWSNGVWNANAAVNYANAYADTNIVPSGRISAFTTTDLNAGVRLNWALPTTIGLSVSNLFNVSPPRTAPGFNAVAYDPSNADPRGRILSLLARVQW